MLGDMSGKCVPGFADVARAAEIDLTTKDTGENDRRKVTHKTTQHVRAEGCRESQADLPGQKQTPVLPGFATDCGFLLNCQVEDRGLEPLASSCRNTHVSGEGGAKSGAVDGENRPIDPDLAHLIGVWDSLKPDTRTAILAIVEAAQGR